MQDIQKLARIQIGVIIPFVLAKLIRPGVLANDGGELFKLFLLSFPNLCEGVIGVLTLTGLGLYLSKQFTLNRKLIYVIAIGLATIYVTTQELKIHNLGGNNVYDPNDLIFSVIGLFLGASIVFYLQPEIRPDSE
ncbi:hypothetical protein [Lewinella sp. W8]|uniref:hypothetical protein n=1 Tax=Lewinella sp. W8 TaxID=2528208 RepID=UPI0010688DBC|nr:hypothetical protein [Lewinella sp. W8]MTB51708.1 hypothetical protein [Lewinella sp. W8]